MTCDGNMKDDALFQQGARTVRFDMTVSLHKGWRCLGLRFLPQGRSGSPKFVYPGLRNLKLWRLHMGAEKSHASNV